MKTIQKIKVENMTSNAGNPIPNQFVIDTPDGTYFQSYNSIIVFQPTNYIAFPTKETPEKQRIHLDRDTWDYSNTTGKYRNQFLGETKKETQARIDSGVYILADLN